MSTPATRPRTDCENPPRSLVIAAGLGAGDRERDPGPTDRGYGPAVMGYGAVVMTVFCTVGSGTMVSVLMTGRRDCTLPPVPLLVTTRPA
jgi:hypothetical protein